MLRQLTDGGSFADTVYAHHQDHEWLLSPIDLQRDCAGRQYFRHGALQCGDQAVIVTELPACEVLCHLRGDLLRSLHADVGNQQLFFELFEQIIIDLLLAEQQVSKSSLWTAMLKQMTSPGLPMTQR